MCNMLLERKQFEEDTRIRDESLFHCASGRIGVRGCFEEGVPEGAVSIRGTYLNGFAEKEAISYNEKLYGFTDSKETIVNLPDAQGIELTVNGKKLCCWSDKACDYYYALDMNAGMVVRHFVYMTENGKLDISFERFASIERPGLFTIGCRVKSVDFSGELDIKSFLNGNVRNFTSTSDPRMASGDGKMLKVNFAGVRAYKNADDAGKVMEIEAETINSHRMVSAAVLHDISLYSGGAYAKVSCEYLCNDELITAKAVFNIVPGDEIVLYKYCYYQELQDRENRYQELFAAEQYGFEELKKEQKNNFDRFWDVSRVLIDSDEVKQEYMDYCLYALYCSAGRDGMTSISAKGLTGEGYEGHYFWDSEIYIFPFFLMTEPKIAKALLEYRYLHLNDARKHAERMGHMSGALYPWRTISGSECSSHYPSGSAQYHINGDIAHAFSSYWYATGDESFLEKTCELLVETARLWIDAGHWYEGQFRIDCVTGPDEYTCLVNNNYYTNSCAAENLLNAARLCGELKKRGNFEALKAKLNLSEEEIEAFRNAGENMYFPHDEKLKIIAQDDSFLKKKRWNIEKIPKDKFPLLMNYHPILINRYQVLKQADSVLANHIYREEDLLTMKRSFEYYEAITTHDSSLSNCIYAIVAARLGDMERAEGYFTSCIGTDTSDQNGNTKDGLHIANMGGVYRVMTCGFGGVSMQCGTLSIFPILPASFSKLSFPVFWQGRRILVSAEKDLCTLQLLEGQPLTLEVFGQQVLLAGTSTVRRTVKGVVFDLDGVITDTAVFHYRAWKTLADSLGISFNEELNENFKGVSRAQCLKLLLAWGNRQVSEAEFDELLERKNNIYCEYLETLTPANILPGIEACLAMLKEKHIPTALFSVSKNTDTILSKLGLTAAFDAVVTGRDIQHSKPHYEGYLLSAMRLGVDPRLCMMVEDSVAGITGAKAVSMKTLAIMARNTAGADKCVPSTAGVQCAVAEMTGCAN